MGNQRDYERGRNDFFSYQFTTASARVTINGVSGKMVERKIQPETGYQGLPAYGGSSDIYFAKGKDGLASQAKLYDGNGKMKLDFDWSHDHTNKDGTVFHKGVVHVQEYKVETVKGHDKFSRLKKARLMTDAEIEKYGPILKHFNPNIKFR